jgi:hypothetical protein
MSKNQAIESLFPLHLLKHHAMKMYEIVEVYVLDISAREVMWLASLHPTLQPDE